MHLLRRVCKIHKNRMQSRKSECVNAIFCFTNSNLEEVCLVGDTVLFAVLQIDFIFVIVHRRPPKAGQSDFEKTK